MLVEEANSRQSLFCKIGAFSCGFIFCRDNYKLTNTSGLGNLDASSARHRRSQCKSLTIKIVQQLLILDQYYFQLTLPVSCPGLWDRASSSLRLPVGPLSQSLCFKHSRAFPFILSYLMSSKNIHLYSASDHPDRCNAIPRPQTQVLVLWNFHCVAARIACSMIANTSPLATCSICKQSNTRPNASPLA